MDAIFDLFNFLDERIDLNGKALREAYAVRKLNDFRWSYNRVGEEFRRQYEANALVQMRQMEREGINLRQVGPRFREFIDTIFDSDATKACKPLAADDSNVTFLSVIVPVHNAASYVEGFMENVLGQTFEDFELILVDDGSADQSLCLMRAAAVRDPRIKVIGLPKNCGASGARNTGLKSAKGKYVRFLDVDDLMPDNSFEVLCAAAKKCGSDIIKGELYGYDYETKQGKKNPWGGREYGQQGIFNAQIGGVRSVWNLYDHQCYLIRRDLVARSKATYPDLKNCQDPPFLAQVIAEAETISAVPQCVYYLVYNRGRETITRRKWSVENYLALLKGYRQMLATLHDHGLLQLCKYKMNTFARDWWHKLMDLRSWENKDLVRQVYGEIAKLRQAYPYDLFDAGDSTEAKAFLRLAGAGKFEEAHNILAPPSAHKSLGEGGNVVVFYPPWTELNPYLSCVYGGIKHKAMKGDIYTALGLQCSGKFGGVVFHLHWTDPLIQKVAADEADASRRLYEFIWAMEQFQQAGGKIVWTVHNSEPHDNKFPTQESVLGRELIERASQIITHNESGKRYLTSQFAAPVGKLAVAPHGNYIGKYRNSVSRDRARQELGVPPGFRHFVFVGQMRRYKGIDDLIEAYRRIRGQHKRVFLTLAGSVPDETYRRELSACLADIEGTKFSPSFVPADRMQLYLNAADMVVLPYKNILTSGSVMLAYSFARSVIVPRLDGLLDVVTHGTDGLVYDDLYSALAQAVGMPESQIEELNRNAYETAKRLDWKEMHEVLNRVPSIDPEAGSS